MRARDVPGSASAAAGEVSGYDKKNKGSTRKNKSESQRSVIAAVEGSTGSGMNSTGFHCVSARGGAGQPANAAECAPPEEWNNGTDESFPVGLQVPLANEGKVQEYHQPPRLIPIASHEINTQEDATTGDGAVRMTTDDRNRAHSGGDRGGRNDDHFRKSQLAQPRMRDCGDLPRPNAPSVLLIYREDRPAPSPSLLWDLEHAANAVSGGFRLCVSRPYQTKSPSRKSEDESCIDDIRSEADATGELSSSDGVSGCTVDRALEGHSKTAILPTDTEELCGDCTGSRMVGTSSTPRLSPSGRASSCCKNIVNDAGGGNEDVLRVVRELEQQLESLMLLRDPRKPGYHESTSCTGGGGCNDDDHMGFQEPGMDAAATTDADRALREAIKLLCRPRSQFDLVLVFAEVSQGRDGEPNGYLSNLVNLLKRNR